jgi:hypothetical protein
MKANQLVAAIAFLILGVGVFGWGLWQQDWHWMLRGMLTGALLFVVGVLGLVDNI